MKTVCNLCPHHCRLEEGQIGFCRARENRNGQIICSNYGKITAIALDPIEKKPLLHFFPGSKILSVGSYGCNLRCSFCQNYAISMVGPSKADTVFLSPETLIGHAVDLVPCGNIGIAYTYNEPLIGYEFVRDCAILARKNDLKNVVVTNGCISEEPFRNLLPWVDAWNIDLKSFRPDFYSRIAGEIETVKRNIAFAASQCHVEVTTLIIPGENDTEEEIRELSIWIASIDRRIPLHMTRFFPQYCMKDRSPTPVSTVYCLAEVARNYLDNVHVGNC